MKVPVSKCKRTLYLTFVCCPGFIVISLLSYFIYKQGTLCFVFKDKEDPIANKTSQLIEQLWSLWNRLVLLFKTSKLGSIEINEDREQAIANMCLNGDITTDALKVMFTTHLPQDINMISRKCYSYIVEIFTMPKLETLLILFFVIVIIIILIKMCCVLMFCCVRKIQQSRHLSTSHKHLCSRCSNGEEPWLLRVSPIENKTFVKAQLGKQQSFRSLSWISKSWIIAFSLSLLWEFIRIYQSKVAERASIIVKGLPSVCDPLSMTIWDSVKEFLRHHFSWTYGMDACTDYYHALLVDPLWEVSPLMVFSSVFSRCLLYPFELTCSSLGRGIRFFFLEIPFQWQPLVLVVILLLSLLTLLMLCGYRLHVPLLLKLEPVTSKRPTVPTRRNKIIFNKLIKSS